MGVKTLTKLLVWRDKFRLLYRDYETLLRPIWKFFLSIIVIVYMNQLLGYDKRLTNILLIVIVSMVSAFAPAQMFVLLVTAFALIHIYAMASFMVFLVLGVFLVLFLLFERFTPSYSYVIVLMPFAMSMNIPLLPALLIGLAAEPAGIIASSCGIIIYFLFKILKSTTLSIGEITFENVAVLYQNVMDIFLNEKEMFLYLIAITAVILMVYIIRLQPIPYVFPVAILAGSVLFLLILLIGELLLRIDSSPVFLLIGSVISALLALIIQFLLLPLDYSRIETVQFSDDDYYYYVRAVPKMQVAAPKKRVKRINAQKVTGNTANLQEVLQQISEQEELNIDSFEEEPSEIFDIKRK